MSTKLGVHGKTLTPKKNTTVQSADFNIAGMIIQSERKYAKAFKITSFTDFQTIFGGDFDSSFYGYESVQAFFQNVGDAGAELYVKSHVGNTGSAIDAVVASATINDTASSPAATLKFQSAFENELEYGVSGNRTGYTITNGYRFTTACDGAPSTGDTFVVLDSVAGVKVGDVLDFVHSTSHVYKKITSVDQSTRKVNFSGAFGSTAHVDGDVVGVIGFRIRTYRKSITGIVKEVETDKGKIYCTLEPEVTDFYVNNIFATHQYMTVADQSSAASAINETYPADVSTITYLTSGADGTAPTTALHWQYLNEVAFNDLPVRFLANCETSLDAVHKNLEIYSSAREDKPKILPVLPISQTKAQLQVIGAGWQRSDEVSAVLVAQWQKITDPFASSPTAGYRYIPNVGFVMGAWIKSISNFGIHWIPTRQVPLVGTYGSVGLQFTDDNDRTDLADSGINLIQDLSGIGVVIRNFRTPSTDLVYRYANGSLMKSFFMVSAVDSLQGSENTPNSFNRVLSDRDAIDFFMRRIWERGSTGTTPTGETFGIGLNEDGSSTTYEDHVQIQADIINNPQTSLDAGLRNVYIYFTYPAPAEVITIGVGLMLRN